MWDMIDALNLRLHIEWSLFERWMINGYSTSESGSELYDDEVIFLWK